MIKHWTRDEEDILVEMRSKGYSFAQIAEELGRSEEAVKTRNKRLRAQADMPGRGISWSVSDVKALYSDLDYDELASKLGKTRRAVEAKCQKLGISKRFAGGWKYGNMNPAKDTTLYLVDFGDFKKVGVTQQSLEDRFRQDKSWTILDKVVMSLDDALETEAEILRNVRALRVKGDIRRGSSECFRSSCTQLEQFLPKVVREEGTTAAQ